MEQERLDFDIIDLYGVVIRPDQKRTAIGLIKAVQKAVEAACCAARIKDNAESITPFDAGAIVLREPLRAMRRDATDAFVGGYLVHIAVRVRDELEGPSGRVIRSIDEALGLEWQSHHDDEDEGGMRTTSFSLLARDKPGKHSEADVI